MEIWAFLLVSTALIVVPGPNVLVVVSTSIAHGRVRGLQTVAGTSAAMAIQLTLAALGTGWLVTLLTNGFRWIKWAGVLYLFYLGLRHLLNLRQGLAAPITSLGSFQRGFWVSLTNPKTILFFAAFLPQFVTPAQALLPQLVLLSTLFLAIAIAIDSGYALLAGQLSACLNAERLHSYQNGASAVLYLGAGAALAASKNG